MVNPTSGVKAAANQFANSVKGLGTDASAAFTATGEALKGGGNTAGRMFLKPVEWTIKVARWPVAAVSGLYRFAKVPMAIATVLGVAYAATSFIRGRAEKRTQHELEAQMTTAQAEVATAQQQRPQQSYMNSVSPQESQLLAERQQVAASHVDAAAARQQVPAPEAARA